MLLIRMFISAVVQIGKLVSRGSTFSSYRPSHCRCYPLRTFAAGGKARRAGACQIVRGLAHRGSTRGLVQASARRGWFVVEPSLEEVLEAFQARRAIETGILRIVEEVPTRVIEMLRAHIAQEREAIAANDIAARSYLLADFHVCMVTAFENHMLAELLRDLTARTILIAALYQSVHDASEACDEHERITDLLAVGDLEGAAKQMISHIGNVESGLTKRVETDPLLDLRQALQQSVKKKGP